MNRIGEVSGEWQDTYLLQVTMSLVVPNRILIMSVELRFQSWLRHVGNSLTAISLWLGSGQNPGREHTLLQ